MHAARLQLQYATPGRRMHCVATSTQAANSPCRSCGSPRKEAANELRDKSDMERKEGKWEAEVHLIRVRALLGVAPACEIGGPSAVVFFFFFFLLSLHLFHRDVGRRSRDSIAPVTTGMVSAIGEVLFGSVHPARYSCSASFERNVIFGYCRGSRDCVSVNGLSSSLVFSAAHCMNPSPA